MTSSARPKTIGDYILSAPAATQEKLWQMHDTIRAAAPVAREEIKWGRPAYSMDKILVIFAVFKQHIGFYPMPSALKMFEKELKNYKTGEGSIQFPLDKPLPITLIKKIVKFRVKENNEGTIKWRS